MAVGIQNFPNIIPADADYLDGDIKDAPSGTPVNRATNGDIQQLFAKLLREASITPNGLRDNETNGYQLYDALTKASKRYDVYVALMNQTGTNAPVPTVLENDLGNIVWSRTLAGTYVGTLAGAFPADRVWVGGQSTAGGITSDVEKFQIIPFPDDTVLLLTRNDSDTLADNLLANISIEIRVYR